MTKHMYLTFTSLKVYAKQSPNLLHGIGFFPVYTNQLVIVYYMYKGKPYTV